MSMRCQNCSAENANGAKFCIECATRFMSQCPKCGFESPPPAKFSAQCAALQEALAPRVESERGESGLKGERRHPTVLFCDLVGSTAIAAQLDPEEWRATVGKYHRSAAEAIARFGGHVAQYLGDGVMAFFGWPEAHDNNAERVGLAIIDAVANLSGEEQAGRAKLSGARRHRFGRGGGHGCGQGLRRFRRCAEYRSAGAGGGRAGTVAISDATQRLGSGAEWPERFMPYIEDGKTVVVSPHRV
jgi:hypothetical protein